jgi:hypothetical protein
VKHARVRNGPDLLTALADLAGVLLAPNRPALPVLPRMAGLLRIALA